MKEPNAMNNRIDWKLKTHVDTLSMLERTIVLCMNRIETAYCDDSEYFDSKCHTLINLLNARQNEQQAATKASEKASDPKPR